MRPVGEVRAALHRAALELLSSRAAVTWVDLAHHAQVEENLARATVKNMVRDGVLVAAGHERRPHANRPMRTFKLALLEPTQARAGTELADVMAGWFRP